MYNMMRRELSSEFDMVLTEIARDNPRSLKVNTAALRSFYNPKPVLAGRALWFKDETLKPLSFQAHINVGFEVVSSSSFDGVCFDIVCWRWR